MPLGWDIHIMCKVRTECFVRHREGLPISVMFQSDGSYVSDIAGEVNVVPKFGQPSSRFFKDSMASRRLATFSYDVHCRRLRLWCVAPLHWCHRESQKYDRG